MRIIDTAELGVAMDAYELHLFQCPDVIPKIGFTVLQSAVLLERLPAWAELGIGTLLRPLDIRENASEFDMVTLRKSAGDPVEEAYSLTLKCVPSHTDLPRLSTTSFKRKGGAIGANTYIHDTQGGRAACADKTLQQMHVNLARHILGSDAAQAKIYDLQGVRRVVEQELRNPALAPAREKGLKAGLKEVVLK